MPKKKTNSIKKKTLFDHLNQITKVKNPNYWDTLSFEDKKTFDNYMIHRYLSMNMEWLDIIAQLQPYTQNLSKEMVYKVYSDLLPKSNSFLKYIGGSGSEKWEGWLVDIIRNHYEVSPKEASDYLTIFYATQRGKKSLTEILEKYGVEPKQIKKLKLNT